MMNCNPVWHYNTLGVEKSLGNQGNTLDHSLQVAKKQLLYITVSLPYNNFNKNLS